MLYTACNSVVLPPHSTGASVSEPATQVSYLVYVVPYILDAVNYYVTVMQLKCIVYMLGQKCILFVTDNSKVQNH